MPTPGNLTPVSTTSRRGGGRSKSISYEDLMGPDEDWRELETTSERRKIQNRLAQRAYRRNLRSRTQEVEKLKSQLTVLQEGQETTEGGETQQRTEAACRAAPSGPMTPNSPSTTTYSIEGTPTPQPDEATDFAQSSLSFPAMDEDFFGDAPLLSDPVLDHFASYQPPTIDSLIAADRCPARPTLHHNWLTDGTTSLSECSPMNTTLTAPPPSRIKPPASEGSLLHLAVSSGHLDTLQLLLRHGAEPIDAKDSEGYTALQRAVMSGRTDLVGALLQHKPPTSSNN
ncbi:hypothetical protein PG995_000214 [Apiospora arundinis]